MSINGQQCSLVKQPGQATLDLPFDRRRTPGKTPTQAAEFSFALPSALVEPLTLLAEKESVSQASIYLAAFGIVLSRYSNMEQISIHSAITRCSTSPVSATEYRSITAPISLSYAPDRSLRVLLKSADRALTTEVEAVDSAKPSFLCHAGFVYNSLRTLEGIEDHNCSDFAAFDISLRVSRRERSVRPALLYRSDLFNEDTVARMARHLTKLLGAMTEAGETSIASLEMMFPEERAQIFEFFAGPKTSYPEEPLHELFAAQAMLRPDAEAVVYGNDRLTYAELDSRSNQVANYLITQGLCSDECVGIFMDRSVDMIVCMLGILKAGGAYVPIDPDYPAARLRFMAQDTALRFVLTEQSIRYPLPTSAAPIYLDSKDSPLFSCSTDPVPNRSNAESLAIVIYTSGSTGTPKAVRIPHRAVVRTVRSTNYLQATAEDRIAQVMSPSFDAAIKEIWLALANGAALIGLRREVLIVPKEIKSFIQRERITLLIVNTAYVHRIALDSPDVFKGLRKVIFGGETAEPAPLRELLKHIGPGILINGYGPTEGCVISTFYEVNEISENATTVPIGHPVSNSSIYLLDDLQRPVPIGVPGEIYIGGEGVAQGYLNRPELTAQYFLPDGFSVVPGRLLYRTGDLARLRANGEFEFLGRRDEQVKVRGHRIELAEVRAAMVSHPGVKQVFLTVREEQAGDKRLVAYVTLRRPLSNPEQSLRQHAKEKLPDHMLPSAFVVVDAVPFTTNGKVDWTALPALREQLDLELHSPPEGELEVRLRTIWQNILHVRNIGVNDSFFDLGGHSLLAARMVAEIEKVTGHNIPVTTLFEAPTIADLAACIAERSYTSAWSPCVALLPAPEGPTRECFFCVHSLGANLVSARKIASLMRPDRTVYGLQPHGLDGQQQPLDTIEAMGSAYLSEIRKVQPHGPYYLGGICLGGVVAYEMAQQLQRAGETVACVLLIDSFLPGPLKYIRTRSNLTEYLDSHLGRLLQEPGFGPFQYLSKCARSGWTCLKRVAAKHDRSSIVEATKTIRAAHIRAFLAYRPQPYSGRVVQIMCADSAHRAYEDRRLAWAPLLANGGFEVRVVPGDHLTMVEEPHVQIVVQELQNSLDRSAAAVSKTSRESFRNSVRRRLSA